jgi:hypothetical protein
MNKSVLLRIFILASTLTFTPLARAEAALFDLVFMLPAALARGFYDWLLKYYWWFFAITALVWLWRVFIGNNPLGWLFGTDERDGLLGFLYPQSRGERIQSPHVWLLVLLILTTLYIFIGSAFIGFGNERARKIAAEKYLNTPTQQQSPQPPATPIKPVLPAEKKIPIVPFAVNLDPPVNPSNSPWPKQSGYLLPPQAEQLNGSTTITLHANSDSPIYIKLCATANTDCQVVRHIFARPQTKFTLNNIPDGTYSLRTIEINGPEYAIARTKNFEILNGTSKQTAFNVLPAKYLRDEDGGDDFYRYETRKF